MSTENVSKDAYDAVVAENARLKERLRDFAGKGTEYASRVAELERVLSRAKPVIDRAINCEATRKALGEFWVDDASWAVDRLARLSKGSQP